MDQLNGYIYDRLIRGCVYCSGPFETRDHVPSKCLLEQPYPPNLPIVECCESCNQSFSKDEQYFVCLIESVLCGSTDPDKMLPEISRISRHLVLPGHHDVKAKDVDLKRLGAVLWLAQETIEFVKVAGHFFPLFHLEPHFIEVINGLLCGKAI